MDRILLAHAQLETKQMHTPWRQNKNHITGITKSTTSVWAKECQMEKRERGYGFIGTTQRQWRGSA